VPAQQKTARLLFLRKIKEPLSGPGKEVVKLLRAGAIGCMRVGNDGVYDVRDLAPREFKASDIALQDFDSDIRCQMRNFCSKRFRVTCQDDGFSHPVAVPD